MKQLDGSTVNGGNGNHKNGLSILIEQIKEQGSEIERVIKVLDKISEKLEPLSALKEFKEQVLNKALEKDDRIIKLAGSIINTLCWVIGCLIIWFTGLKEHLPQIADVLLKIF